MLSKHIQCNIKRGGTIHWGKNPHVLSACILPAAKIRVNYECMKEKYITEAVPPSTTRSQPVTLDEVLGPTRWLPWHWCGSAAALHPQSLTLHWGQVSSLHHEADSKLGHVTRKDDGFTAAWDLSEEIKKIVKSLPPVCRRSCIAGACV